MPSTPRSPGAFLTPQRLGWIVLATLVAVAFFIVALSEDVYHDTSPAHLAARLFGDTGSRFGRPFGISLHILVRKFYSVVAFAIVGWTAQRALPPSSKPALRMTILVALYSAAIEYGQWLEGSTEGLRWNTVDVACGALGGYLAIRVGRLVRRPRG
jgi:hypothetical protein